MPSDSAHRRIVMQFPTVVRSGALALVVLLSAGPQAAAQSGQARVAGYLPAPQARPLWGDPRLGDLPDRLVTLQLESTPLEEALLAIARQAQVHLTYSNEALPAGRRVTASLNAVPAVAAFARVLEGTELQAVPSRSDRMTIIRRPPPLPEPERPDAVAQPELVSRALRGISIMGLGEDATVVGIIRGRVTEAGSGRPIAGAQVLLVGSARGAVTSAG